MTTAAAVATTSPRTGVLARSGRWFADRGVRTKILAAVGLLAAVAISTTAVASHDLSRAGADIDGLAVAQESVIAPLALIHQDEIKARSLIAQTAVAPTPSAKADLIAQIKENDAELDGAVAKIDPIMSVEGAQVWTPFKKAWGEFKQLRDTVLLPLAKANDYAGYQAAYDKRVAPVVSAIADSMDGADAGGVQYFTTTAKASADSDHRAEVEVWLVLGIGLLLALGLSLYIAAAIRRPLMRMKVAAQAMARKDLTVFSGVDSRDEVGQIGAALKDVRTEFRELISGITSSSEALAAASEELSATTMQVSSAAEETSAQAAVVSSASEEVSRNVHTVAAGSEQMDASIREIAQNANEAAKVASSAMSAAEATNTTVSKLGVSSQEIGNVVKVITSIAAQTNLLALNATIEAARAGEAGKGFAVVANEVKELAQETTRATEDIVSRVEAIQADTASAVNAIGEITAIIASINDFQMTIASAVEEQTATTNEMSRNVADAASGTGEIASNITGVASAASSTTEALAQAKTAIDELARMSADLRAQVASFVY